MMRITLTQVSDGRTTARLEGSIGAKWAGLLERECSSLLHAGLFLTLDLSGLDFVDWPGVETLRRLGQRNVEIRCRRGAVASLLEARGVRITLMPGGEREDDDRRMADVTSG